MARPPVSTVVGDTRTRPLLRFDTQREVLAMRLREAGGNASGAIAGGEGLSINIAAVLNTGEISALSADRAAAAVIGRVTDAAAARLLDRVRQVSRPTYDTGLFYSSWRARTGTQGGLRTQIELTNQAPYAAYVHRKGTNEDRKVVELYVKPLVRGAALELLDDIVQALARRLPRLALAKLGKVA